MKQQFFTLLAAAGLMGLTACTDPDAHSTWDNGGTEVTFTASIEQPAGATSEETWTDGERIGVFMMPYGQGLASALERNLAYDSDASGKMTPVAGSKALTIPADRDSVAFVAYAPYRSDARLGTVAVDVTDQSRGRDIDLLYSDNLHNHPATQSTAALSFRHCLTKLVVDITADASIGSTDGLTVTLTGAPATASFNLADATLTADAPSAAPIQLVLNADELQAAGIVIPAASTTGMQLNFTLDGLTYVTDLTATSLPAGSIVNVTATLSATDGQLTVTLGQATIEDWTEEPGGHIDADFDEGGSEQPGPGDDTQENTIIFEETMGSDPIEKDGNYWPYLSDFTGWVSGLTFTDVNSTLSARRTNGQNHIWFPANKENDLQIEGFNTEGFTTLTLTYKLAANLYSAGETQDAAAMKGSFNGVAFETPARVLANPDDNNQFYTMTVELPAEAASATSVLHFTTTAADNQMGLRLAEIKLTGTK